MLPLPPFTLHSPATLDEALRALRDLGPDARLIAGGTNLLPNMKQGLVAPAHLISLARVRELSGVRTERDALHIGAMTSLASLASNADVRARAAALAEAAASVGGPHHRRMGTLGGNLCLDTRCRYYNQSAFWRGALGHCLKKDGEACHVVQGGKRCVAAASNDTAAAAIALGAVILLVGPNGARRVTAQDFYTADGASNTVRLPDEIVVGVEVALREGRASAYEKLRRRGAVDFPLLSVGACADVAEGRVASLSLVVSALAARPRVIARAQELSVGRARDAVPIAVIAEEARRGCTPLPNIDGDTLWRKEMIAVLVQRALRRCVG